MLTENASTERPLMTDDSRYPLSRRTIVLLLLALSLVVELVAFKILSRPNRVPLDVLGLRIVNQSVSLSDQGLARASDTTVAVTAAEAPKTSAAALAFESAATGVGVEIDEIVVLG